MAVTIIFWHSVFYARRFGFETAKRVFYLRYSLLSKKLARHQAGFPVPTKGLRGATKAPTV